MFNPLFLCVPVRDLLLQDDWCGSAEVTGFGGPWSSIGAPGWRRASYAPQNHSVVYYSCHSS